QARGYVEGKKVSFSLNLKNIAVLLDSDTMIIVSATGKGSWFNGKKNIRGINSEIMWRCDRQTMTIDVQGTGDLDFYIEDLETRYC
ncbi:MAG: hypothetical protein KKE50_06290, partial [Nanoarchaeota archaeon]|nr:hypothetical protein [Nanoarchaeota archaeon]